MKKYSYKAIDLNGNIIKDNCLANDEKQLFKIIHENGLFLIKYKNSEKKLIKNTKTKVSHKDIAMFCKQLSEMLNCGINILEALRIIREDKINKYLKNCLLELEEMIYKGYSIHKSMSLFPEIFPAFMLEIIEVGEKSGRLEKVLSNLSKYYLAKYKLNKRLKSAAIYPIMIFIISIVFIFIIFTKVLPNLALAISDMTNKLPSNLETLLKLNTIFSSFEFKFGLLACTLLLYLLIKQNKYKGFFQSYKYKIPIIKKVFLEINQMKFSNEFYILIGSGVSIVNSLEIIEESTKDNFLKEKYKNIIYSVNQGESLSQSLEKSNLFHGIFLSMVRIGEEAGSLEEMLKVVLEINEININEFINKISKQIEPVVIIVVGFIVSAIVMNIFIPIIDSMYSLDIF
ncbi:putative type II secretion system protein F [Clostridium homopropionicum DSM 5847]|uniref:Putative type II secretion system protein F n=1 Tax=Clostridium homopropionicum DSM 5847 TaxID=1121318 RepID=A0A0L6ZDB4_9CLOT|nr:type II secretion system F family protein [Clostridium homopropionicum]KOA20960.1 putative type II secretion system protein F [Clostridium homopropionicum DSM 5847]SFG01071.1 type II secretion system protein F (GspF) [Clostridium homopropionicum]